MTTTWHATPDTIVRFATDPDAIDNTEAASLELHLLECGECRAAVAVALAPEAVESSWQRVAERIDPPKPELVERVLRALGVRDTYARVVAATRPLRLTALGSIAVIAAGIATLAQSSGSAAPFLVLAPLVPLVAVAAAFAAGAEPAGEAGAATAMAGVGLVMRRAVAVLTATVVLLAVATLALPDVTLADAAWVLPALALSTGALALSTWIRVETAAGALVIVWLGALWTAAAGMRGEIDVARLAPLSGRGQLVCAAIVLLSAAAIGIRRDSFATLGRAS